METVTHDTYRLGATTWKHNIAQWWASDDVADTFVTEKDLIKMGAVPIESKEIKPLILPLKTHISDTTFETVVDHRERLIEITEKINEIIYHLQKG